MAVPTRQAFLLRFPEFGEISTDVVDGAIAEAGRSTPESVWGQTQTDGVTYLAAHLLASRVVQMGMQVGATSGMPTGVSIASTLYGQEYQRLLGNLPLTGFAF